MVELRDPEFLEKAVGEMLDVSSDLATCDVFPLSDQYIDHFLHKATTRMPGLGGHLYPHAPGFCMLARRELHEKIGGFDEGR